MSVNYGHCVAYNFGWRDGHQRGGEYSNPWGDTVSYTVGADEANKERVVRECRELAEAYEAGYDKGARERRMEDEFEAREKYLEAQAKTNAQYTEHSLPVVDFQELFQAHEAQTNKE